MTEVLNQVREVNPNDSDAVKDVLNRFFLNLPKIDNSNPTKWFRALADVINRFPKYCMPHRLTIENVVCKSINSHDYYYVIEAAKCTQALQQVRPVQEKTATPKTSWREQMTLLCNAAHSLITAIFPHAVDMHNGTNTKDSESSLNSPLTTALLNISLITNIQNKGDKQSILQFRLKNIFVFIQAMLVEIYPVAKPVNPQMILDVVVRAVSVSSGTKETGVDVALIKIEALRTIDALIACLGSNLIPFSPLVFRLLMQTFRWTSENLDTNSNEVRCKAYASVTNWLNTLSTHRSAATARVLWEDELANHIVKDVAQPEKTVELTMGPPPTKHMSKKAKRKYANAKLLESSIASHMPGEKNKIVIFEKMDDSVAMAALDCAETFLQVCGRFLKATTYQLLCETTLRECYAARSCAGAHDVVRACALLRVAEAARRCPPAARAPPTHHCLQLYSVMLAAGDPQISKFCTQALLDIRLHLHHSPPSLNFDLEESSQKKTAPAKRKKVSEKNMSVLKSLLGSERMASLTGEADIITIQDEPSPKKSRNDGDEISISSNTDSSVEEVSDDSDVEEVELHDEDVTEKESDDNTETDTVEKIVTIEKSNDTIDSVPVDTDIIIDPAPMEDDQNSEATQIDDDKSIGLPSTENDTSIGATPVDNGVSIETPVSENDDNIEIPLSQNDRNVKTIEIKSDIDILMKCDVAENTNNKCMTNDVGENPVNVESTENTEAIFVEAQIHTEPAQENLKGNDPEATAEVVQGDLSIHTATTQMPQNISTETKEGEEAGQTVVASNNSNPITNNTKPVNDVDENIPSSNETDDIITCGQIPKSSQETYQEKSDETDVIEMELLEVPKVNGKVSTKNGLNVPANKNSEVDAAKDATKCDGVSIEDMMADFVDEVNEDLTVA